MSNFIDRSNPGALAEAGGTTFRTNLNADRDVVYASLVALETQHEQLVAALLGNGTLTANSVDLTIDDPVVGRVYCGVGYKAAIGACVETTAAIYQSYTNGILNYVFLKLATTGVLSLTVKATDTPSANEILVATVDASGTPAIDNAPATKPFAPPVA
jgi:hypothetical protein